MLVLSVKLHRGLYGLSSVDRAVFTQAKASSDAPLQWCMLYASSSTVCIRLQCWSTPVLQLNGVLWWWFHPLCSWSWLAWLLGYRSNQQYNNKNTVITASRILVVCIFHVTQLCNFTVYFTVKYLNSLAHAHYYPCNRYQAFIFRASVRPFCCVREKLGLGVRDEARRVYT